MTRALMCVIVLSVLAMPSGSATARVYWSSVAAACFPDRGALQGDNYTSTEQGGVLPRSESLDPVVLVCAVPFKQGVPAPTILSMTYRDTTGSSNAASVTAELVQVNRTTGGRSVVSSVSSDSSNVQTYNYLRSTFSKTLDFAGFYYHVRILITRTATVQNVESIGVALEVSPIASFGPALSYARVGTTTDSPTFPQQLTVTLSEPATADTTVRIQSLEPGALTADNVTISKGSTSAPVLVTALAQDSDVGITATLQGQATTAHVRVLGDNELPSTVILTPNSLSIAPGASATFKLTLDVPAKGGAIVNLAVTPSNGGVLPASVIIPEGEISKDFIYIDSSGNDALIAASFGASVSSAVVIIAQP